ncbi:TPA: DNA-binding response regulator [candidate division CPR2 bacterium]|nr:MAG: DNA-binding response regulator [candidate division CPR2 bacterium GWD1_39_7]OGB71878.1 MAG: DNA-binding response regulator [candidate division CPR2 bacterium GWD2_39_7]HBG82029.1 DNA-binding response regulator [candidate division CPR2 bacterium]
MRILLTEDNKDLAKSIKAALESECYEVDLAGDGEKASFLARTNDYDLIILDINLPKKDGKQVCTEIREDGKIVPILMLSVISEIGTKVDLLDTGADDYLTKPFSQKELLARIRALLRRPQEIKGEVLEVGDLIVDTKKHIVKRKGSNIDLTIKEYILLEYLIKNAESVLTRSMILEHVWDMNADLFSNAIEVHISNLRKKIDLAGMKKLIHTVPGRGYKLELKK